MSIYVIFWFENIAYVWASVYAGSIATKVATVEWEKCMVKVDTVVFRVAGVCEFATDRTIRQGTYASKRRQSMNAGNDDLDLTGEWDRNSEVYTYRYVHIALSALRKTAKL